MKIGPWGIGKEVFFTWWAQLALPYNDPSAPQALPHPGSGSAWPKKADPVWEQGGQPGCGSDLRALFPHLALGLIPVANPLCRGLWHVHPGDCALSHSLGAALSPLLIHSGPRPAACCQADVNIHGSLT